MPPLYSKVEIHITCPWALTTRQELGWIDAGSFRDECHIVPAIMELTSNQLITSNQDSLS